MNFKTIINALLNKLAGSGLRTAPNCRARFPHRAERRHTEMPPYSKITVCFLLTSAIVILLLVIAENTALADGLSDCKNIQTDKGKVTGVLDEKNGLCVYKGVPYAAPPLGNLRFALPQEHAPWSDTLTADRYSNECPQFPITLMETNKVTGSEDCLYLNIWQPLTAADSPLPVMVFIHGGGFVSGSGNQDWYEGSDLASFGNVIAVTFNYRLNVLGFLVHPALRDQNGNAGNYGIYDQIAALQWVQRNIGSFGGDPQNVTIFGESAGGMSVGIHLASPLSKGLFNKAIIESGPVFMLNKTAEEEEKIGIKIAEKAGCKDPATVADCLRALDARKFVRTARPVLGFASDAEHKEGFPFHPVVDGK
ncbi:MAG: carboxylesterase family protein, partial [bacterium]